MLLPANILGILFALTSALVWGSGDFSGGFATRKANQFQVLALSALSGIGILVVCALAWGESLPSLRGAMWAMLAGAAGTVGIAALYRALSMEDAANVAPISGVIGAALPVGFSILIQGMPGTVRLAGFALAFLGIWLVSRSAAGERQISRQGFLLACLAGAGFGGFFILMALVEPGKVFTPLILARSMNFCIALLLLWVKPLTFPGFQGQPDCPFGRCAGRGGDRFLHVGPAVYPA